MEISPEALMLLELLEEQKKRIVHKSITYTPMEKQEEFHRSEAYIRLAFGGNRSGKTYTAANEGRFFFEGKHPYQKIPPKSRIWVLSVEYRTIYEGMYLHFKEILPWWNIKRVGPKIPGYDMPSFIESNNGSRIDFISIQGGEETRKKIQSAEVDLIIIDEEIPGSFFTELEFRLATRGGRFVISATLVQSELWLLNLEQRAEAGDPDVALFRLNTLENKYNSEIGVQRAIGNLSPEEYEVRILGKSRRRKGLVYGNFSNSHLVDPFEIPKEWFRGMCFDPGFRTAAALWFALEPETQTHYLYREMYLHNTTLEDVVVFIRNAEKWIEAELPDGTIGWVEGEDTENIAIRLIDPAAFKTHSDGSLAIGFKLADKYGFDFEPANNDKTKNIEDVRELMKFSLDGQPRLKVFKSLVNFQEEIKTYKFKEDKGKPHTDSAPDRPVKRRDHLMNNIEYIASYGAEWKPSIKTIEDFARMPDEEIDYGAFDHPRMMRVQIFKARRRMRKQNEDILY